MADELEGAVGGLSSHTRARRSCEMEVGFTFQVGSDHVHEGAG